MRKYVWAGVAVVVFGATGVYLAADFAAHHPDSWFGRCTALAGYLGSKCNPFAGIGAAVTPHGSCEGGAEPCEPAQISKPDAVEDAVGGVADVGGEPDEPIKVEPQAGFADFPPDAPASEETPEPGADPTEESEFPAEVAAPAHEETTLPSMPYVEDAAPTCKTCGTCPAGCCDKNACTKDCSKKDCCAKSCCDQNCCAKSCCTKDCCEKATCCNNAHYYVMFGIVLNAETCQTSKGRKPWCPAGCCLEGCCDWFMDLLGIHDCAKCCGSKPECSKKSGCGACENCESPASSKPASNSSKCDDVPNCQEDPSYSHQYPSCPYNGSKESGCPSCPVNQPSTSTPKSSPLDEVMPLEKKKEKTALKSVLYLVPQSYGRVLDPLFLGTPGNRVISALRAVTGIADEDCDVHPDVDTMEARPTDVDRSSDTPF